MKKLLAVAILSISSGCAENRPPQPTYNPPPTVIVPRGPLAPLVGSIAYTGKDSQERPCSIKVTYEDGRAIALMIEGYAEQLGPGQQAPISQGAAPSRLRLDPRQFKEMQIREQGAHVFGRSKFSGESSPESKFHRSLRLDVNYRLARFDYRQTIYIKPSLKAHRVFLTCEKLASSVP